MKLVVKCSTGLRLLRPSRECRVVVHTERGLDWENRRLNGGSRRLYPREVTIAPGSHQVELKNNPIIPGGEPWLVLKGSRVGAAESYLRQLAAATRGTTNAVEVTPDS